MKFIKPILVSFLVIVALAATAIPQAPSKLYLQPPYSRYKQQASAPAATKTGYNMLYAKDDGFYYKIDGGSEVTIVDSSNVLDISGATTLTADLLFGTDTKLQFRDTGIFLNSGADGKLTISSDGAGADDITLSGTVTLDALLTSTAGISVTTVTASGTAALNNGITVDTTAFTVANTSGNVATAGTLDVTGAATFTLGSQSAAVARTATADGLTTGTIAAGTRIVAVTAGGDADSIIVLPAPVVGNQITLFVGATGFELRTSAPATIAINGGADADAESAIGANVIVYCTCTSATTWICYQQNSAGTLAATQVAAP